MVMHAWSSQAPYFARYQYSLRENLAAICRQQCPACLTGPGCCCADEARLPGQAPSYGNPLYTPEERSSLSAVPSHRVSTDSESLSALTPSSSSDACEPLTPWSASCRVAIA